MDSTYTLECIQGASVEVTNYILGEQLVNQLHIFTHCRKEANFAEMNLAREGKRSCQWG